MYCKYTSVKPRKNAGDFKNTKLKYTSLLFQTSNVLLALNPSTMASAGAVLLEARPFRPFKSSEEYLYAMKEDLAEWLTVLYPELRITADNFLDRLDTGVALCRVSF